MIKVNFGTLNQLKAEPETGTTTHLTASTKYLCSTTFKIFYN